MSTFWLTGKTGYTLELPNYDEMFAADDPLPCRLPVTVGRALQARAPRQSVESGFSETTIDPSLSQSK